MGYYYADANRQPVGPLSADEVLRMCRDGQLRGDSPLFAEGGTTWATVDTLLRPPSPFPNVYAPPAPSVCRSCGAMLAPATKWCGNCHASAIPGVIGTLATPGRRLAAYLLGSVVPVGAVATAFGVAYGVTRDQLMAGFIAAGLAIAYIGWACTLYAHGTTPAKTMLGMDVIDEHGHLAGFGRMLVREWPGKMISHLVMYLGFIWILIDKDRQCWHDKLVSTYVVKRPDMV